MSILFLCFPWPACFPSRIEFNLKWDNILKLESERVIRSTFSDDNDHASMHRSLMMMMLIMMKTMMMMMRMMMNVD